VRRDVTNQLYTYLDAKRHDANDTLNVVCDGGRRRKDDEEAEMKSELPLLGLPAASRRA